MTRPIHEAKAPQGHPLPYHQSAGASRPPCAVTCNQAVCQRAILRSPRKNSREDRCSGPCSRYLRVSGALSFTALQPTPEGDVRPETALRCVPVRVHPENRPDPYGGGSKIRNFVRFKAVKTRSTDPGGGSWGPRPIDTGPRVR